MAGVGLPSWLSGIAGPQRHELISAAVNRHSQHYASHRPQLPHATLDLSGPIPPSPNIMGSLPQPPASVGINTEL